MAIKFFILPAFNFSDGENIYIHRWCTVTHGESILSKIQFHKHIQVNSLIKQKNIKLKFNQMNKYKLHNNCQIAYFLFNLMAIVQFKGNWDCN